MRLSAGDLAPQLRLVDVEGNPVMLGRRTHRTLLCFFGDAACAFCNVYIYDLIECYQRLASLGLGVIVLYNARQESVWRFVSNRPRPFPVIADPSAIAHNAYGVEHSLWGKLKGIATRAPTFLKGLRMVGAAGLNANTTMPANFLIDTSGRIAEAHYGSDPGDHIPFQRVEAFAGRDSAGVECIDNARSVAGATTLLRNGVRGP